MPLVWVAKGSLRGRALWTGLVQAWFADAKAAQGAWLLLMAIAGSNLALTASYPDLLLRRRAVFEPIPSQHGTAQDKDDGPGNAERYQGIHSGT